jgi:O-antigen/teichoic acid export membrane protein
MFVYPCSRVTRSNRPIGGRKHGALCGGRNPQGGQQVGYRTLIRRLAELRLLQLMSGMPGSFAACIAMSASGLLEWLPMPLQQRLRQFRPGAAGPGFAWNVFVMLAGTIAGQGISLLLSPVLTRLYSPSEFGYLSVYSAVLTISAVIASLGLDLAIPIAATELESANLLALCGLALVGTTVLVALSTWLIPAHMLAVLWLGPLASYRYLLPIGFACLGGYYVMVAVATWAGAFKDIARTRISQGITGPGSQILLGLCDGGTPGLVVGYVIGQSSGTLLLFARVVLRQRALLRDMSWVGIVAAARRYAHFPLFASWARVLDMAGSGTILFVLFSACYSSEVAGFMFLSDRVIARPLLLVSTSLLQVFTGEAGRAVNNDPAMLRRRFYQVVPLQFLFATGWILLANAVAGWAFPLLFGAEWAAAIPYLRALSLAYLGLAVLHPVSTTLQMLEHQVTAAVWQVSRLLLMMAGVMLPWYLGRSAVTALWISSITQVGCVVVVFAVMVVSIERIGIEKRRRRN